LRPTSLAERPFFKLRKSNSQYSGLQLRHGSREAEMRGILIVVGIAALAYGADSYWYHGVYVAALRDILSQILVHSR
jgi:hypothetical protein